jgi:uncharacterized protein
VPIGTRTLPFPPPGLRRGGEGRPDYVGGVNALELADYRARVAAMYLADTDLAAFRRQRDALFAGHPQSPIPMAERASFTGLSYFPASPGAAADVAATPADGEIAIDTGGPDGVLRYRRVALLDTPWGALTLFELEGYGGGLFLPFRDTTAPTLTYGAGRYLTDTAKGTFGRGVTALPDGRVRLDFNYAYNPSCAYDSRWACPLAPPENRLDAAIEAGEQSHGH